MEPAVQMSDKEELEGVNETMLDAPGIEAFEETDEVEAALNEGDADAIAEEIGDLCFAEICLEVQVLCLLVLFCFHKQKIPPAPEGEYVRAIFSAS